MKTKKLAKFLYLKLQIINFSPLFDESKLTEKNLKHDDTIKISFI